MSRRLKRRAGLLALGVCLSGMWSPHVSRAQTVILYGNDFESPNEPLEVNCGNSLDGRGINELYGSEAFQFTQDFSVEAVFLHDPAGLYRAAGDHGQYAIGMLSDVQDDKLALTFNTQGHAFINVGLDISSIDVQDCGGPFGVSTPRLRISLLDSPGGAVDYSQLVLDSDEITGDTAPDAWTFRWKSGVVGLSASGSHDGYVTILFDLLDGGYAVFDNLTITASMASKVVDLDLDGVVDDQDNCPTRPNADQRDSDADGVGDACDPAPDDASLCGDRDADGLDDCGGTPITTPDAGSGEPPASDADASVPVYAHDAATPSGAAGDEPGAGAAANRGDKNAAFGCCTAQGADHTKAPLLPPLAALGVYLVRRRRRRSASPRRR